MISRIRVITAVTGPVLAILASAACDSRSALPAAPSSGQPTIGATIRGTVEGAGGASSGVGALSTGASLRVSIVGTTLVTTTDTNGNFVLQGLPSGRVELRFEGPGVDARLEISGLQEGQEIRITVRVSGSQATLLPSAASTPSPAPTPSPSPSPGVDDEVELTGRLDSISGSTLVVASRTVFTDSGTVVRRSGQVVGFAALQVGQTLEVEGVPVPGGVRARKITIEDENDDDGEDDDDSEVEFKGRIDSISAPSLVVAGRPVGTDASTRILDQKGKAITLTSLRVGDRVEVEGVQQGSAVLARKIKLDD